MAQDNKIIYLREEHMKKLEISHLDRIHKEN